jgi:hypothetical protein
MINAPTTGTRTALSPSGDLLNGMCARLKTPKYARLVHRRISFNRMTPATMPPVPTINAIAAMSSTRGLVVKSPRWRIPWRMAWSEAPMPLPGNAVSVTSFMFSLEVAIHRITTYSWQPVGAHL